jgi:hypothetical protein
VKRKRASEVTVQNVKKKRANNKDNEPATGTSAQPPPLAPSSDNLQYSNFPVIQKFHFYRASTGCLMKNASTLNFVIYYPISMNKKIKDMVFQALQNSHKMFFFLALSSIANDSQLFFLNGHM